MSARRPSDKPTARGTLVGLLVEAAGGEPVINSVLLVVAVVGVATDVTDTLDSGVDACSS
jgi:hypothetical protein